MKYVGLSLIAMIVLSCTAALADDDRQDRSAPPSPPSFDNSSNQSAPRGMDAQQLVEDFDDNGDGVLQRNELPPRLAGRFDQLDRDGDDHLTKSELQQRSRSASRRSAGRPTAPIEFIYIWVSDADSGHLSLNELQRAYDTLQKVDKNGNGELARSELQACRKANLAKWARMVARRLDDNDDQKISQQEAQGTFLASSFDRVDDNGDGKVTRQELQQCIAEKHRGNDTGSSSNESLTRSEEDGQNYDDESDDDRD